VTARRDALDRFVAEARSVPVESEAGRRGWKLRRCGVELVGPCPACGGKDRFSINRVKNVFHCRRSGAGGDAIALVQYVDGVDFLSACSTLSGAQIPDRDAAAPDPELMRRREAERAEAARRREEEASRYREKVRRDAFDFWRRTRPAAEGDAVAAYLAGRGLPLLPGIRTAPALDFWHGPDGARAAIHTGPAMVAAVRLADGRFGAVHTTWVDPDRPGSKATISDPATGEVLPSKKVRGAKKGGAIRLVTPAGATRLVVGEGIETVASVWLAEGRADTAYWVAVDLGNLGGQAAESVRHPTATLTDKAGRVRAARVPGPEPDLTDSEAFVPPAAFTDVVLLGDGDSDRFTTEAALTRAARRAMRLNPGTRAAIAWAPAGADFNDVLMGAVA
jgi:hypothetical protein